MSNLFDKIPDIMMKWKNKAATMTFFGQPIQNLSKEELLACIGCLSSTIDRLETNTTNLLLFRKLGKEFLNAIK